MKKVIALVLCALIAVALVGCSGGSSDGVVGTWKYVLSEEEKQEWLTVGEELGQGMIATIEDRVIEVKSDGTWELKSISTKEIIDQGKYTVKEKSITMIEEEHRYEYSYEIKGNTLEQQNGEAIYEKQWIEKA